MLLMETQTVTTKSFVPLYHHFTKNRLTYCRQNEAKKQINNNKRRRNPALAVSLRYNSAQQMTETSLVVRNLKRSNRRGSKKG